MKIRYLLISLLVVLILLIVLGAMMIGCDDKKKDDTMHFTVEDGTSISSTHGCFPLICAGKNVDIDPTKYHFYIAQKGHTPQELDFEIRTHESDGTPSGGDRNSTYDYTLEGEKWSEGEYIGFDMPKKQMGINVVSGNIYEVSIHNKEGEMIYRGTFVYKGGCVDF